MTDIESQRILTPQSTKTLHLETKKLPPSVKQFPMQPYQQGAFDSYCGVYSIINASRLIAFPSDGMGEEFCEELFEILMKYTQMWFGLRHLSREGMPLWLMKRLLYINCRYLGIRTRMNVSYSRFLFRKGGMPMKDVLQMMRQELAGNRCAFTIELQGTHSHWSVVRGITDAQIQLFDSDGLSVLKTADIRMSYDRKRQAKPHILRAGSIL